MRKQLSINIDSVMTSYSYYAFSQCIITAEERIGSLIAEFSIFDSKTTTWNSKDYITRGDNEES